MHVVGQLFELLWSLLRQLFEQVLAPILGPFTRAISVRRVDDGRGP